MTAVVSLLFIAMILIDRKITIFFLHLFVTFFGNNYNIGELTSATSTERMTILFSWMPHSLINEKFIC